MLSIAGGIILALLILAFLPEFLFFIVCLFGLVFAVLIVLFILGFLHDSNFADVIATLTFLIVIGSLYFLLATYVESRNLHLFGRKLILLASFTFSPKKQVEKELALECLLQDIAVHCENRNSAIKNKALDSIPRQVGNFLYKYREYGELIALREENVIQFSTKELGYLFKVQISANFPLVVFPTYLIEGYETTKISELKSRIKNIVKRKVLSHERSKQHKK